MNILTDRLIRIELTGGGTRSASLPEVYEALIADKVESFPALRAHQMPAWHMFLVQLGTIAAHRAGLSEPPSDAATWARIIRDLTAAEFPDDEPWRLVVDDRTKPAFLQPPVHIGIVLGSTIATPDELDMVLTAKNHELKQAVAATAALDDWIFALISLQTSEGYNGSGKYGIARMNGGSSSRVCLGLAPLQTATSGATIARPGPRAKRDIAQLLARRHELLETVAGIYPTEVGIALVWTRPWPEAEALTLEQLDLLFIEVCRRVRLSRAGGTVIALAGTSKTRRVDATQFNGMIGDPWAPVHATAAKALTLGDSGEFDYRKIVELLSPEWVLPALAKLGPREEDDAANWMLVAQAFARGNSKTGGFQERVIPLRGRTARRFRSRRIELHHLARNQISEIDAVDKILRNAVALGAAGGDREKINEHAYESTRPARQRLKLEADRLFFPALWSRFEAEEDRNEARALELRAQFIRQLVETAKSLLDEALADLPCPVMRRPRAEARARAQFTRSLRQPKFGFPDIFAPVSPVEDATHAS